MDKGNVIALFEQLHIEDNKSYPLHDMGIAQLFYEIFQSLICYVLESKCWYIFDGKRWVKDEQRLKIMEYCKIFTYALADYGSRLQGEKIIKVSGSLCNIKRRENIIKDCTSINPKSLSAFDTEKLLFNCQNGILDLKRKKFTPHSSKYLITRLSNVIYDEKAKCNRWLEFVGEIMQGDTESIRFLQKAFGYALTGNTDLECFFIFYGSTTRNGKSTCCETISNIFGDYASNVQPETIGRNSKSGSAPTPDIARLKGARLVIMPEPERGLELNVSLIKQLTGGDKYTGRFLHENPIEFTPEFKIIINTNHRPRINDDTVFSSARVKLLPFERHFNPQEQDTGLKALFREESNMSAILNWIIEGYYLLQIEGLTEPQKMTVAVNEYREESDILGTFLNENLCQSDGYRLATTKLYERYKEWSSENGYHALNNKNFVGELRKRYVIKRNGTRGNEILDVALLPKDFHW